MMIIEDDSDYDVVTFVTKYGNDDDSYKCGCLHMPHSPCWIIVLQFVGGHDDDSFMLEIIFGMIKVRHELQAPNPLTMGDMVMMLMLLKMTISE